MISEFFIDRPVLANVLAILTVLVGAVALFSLPVAQYPDIVPPTVQVSTRYPGASALDVMQTVALPIEQQVNGVQGMLYMQSSSASDGSYALIVTFAIGTDPDLAQVLVQNRVSAALASLPQAVQTQGVSVQKKSTAILQIVTLTSPDRSRDSLYLSNYAAISLKDELARLPGVGNVNVFGAGQYAMRIWLDPDRMQARAITVQDVSNAVQQQSQAVTAGQIGAPPTLRGQTFQYTLSVQGRLDQVAQFEDIIIKVGNGGAIVRLRDIARIELGAQNYGQVFTLNGQPAAGMAIFQTPGANALGVAAAVNARMDALARSFPPGVTASVPFDTTAFVRASIEEVYWTLGEAAVLVLLVILLFIQDWRAMLVPATTVPVTIIGAFAAMAALGFGINLSTLFAIVLAIGIVVDDAIVVVEGAARFIEQGLPPRQAAARAMQTLMGPIIGITLVLMCVFVPAAFLPGLTGRLYAQFALVIAATAAISAVNAATLKPMQCAAWLRTPKPAQQRIVFFRVFNRLYAGLERRYAGLIARMVGRSRTTAMLGVLLAAAGIAGIAALPTGFLPPEDQGYMLVAVQLPDGASLERTQAALDKVRVLAGAVPGVARVIGIAGISVLDNSAPLANAGVAYVMLTPWGERGSNEGLRATYLNLNAAMERLDEAQSVVIVPPAIQGIGNAGGFTAILEQRRGQAFAPLQAVTGAIVQRARADPAVQHVASTFSAEAPQLSIEVDRVKTSALQVPIGDVFQALSTYLGSSFAGQVTKFGRTFQVYAQADAKFRALPAEISQLTVRNSAGQMVPLGTLVQVVPRVGPALIGLYNLYPAATIVGAAADGYSSGQALDVMDRISDATAPPGYGHEWAAMSYQERALGGQLYVAFGLAILLVYLVLAGQYGSWVAPFAVILAVPLSLLGPVAALTAFGAANNLYTQIGLVLLIALSAKNAILIVEMAREAHLLRGMTVADAAVEAARERLRPIMMTSLAFALGALPLVLASGAGANARKSIGIAVVSGMVASTCLAVLFVPSFFVVLQRRTAGRNPIAAGRRDEPKAEIPR